MRPPINLMLTCRGSSRSPDPTTKCLECPYLETERFHRQVVFSFLLLVKGDAVETDIEMSCRPVTEQDCTEEHPPLREEARTMGGGSGTLAWDPLPFQGLERHHLSMNCGKSRSGRRENTMLWPEGFPQTLGSLGL